MALNLRFLQKSGVPTAVVYAEEQADLGRFLDGDTIQARNVCRVCVVEVVGSRTLVPAMPASGGLYVRPSIAAGPKDSTMGRSQSALM